MSLMGDSSDPSGEPASPRPAWLLPALALAVAGAAVLAWSVLGRSAAETTEKTGAAAPPVEATPAPEAEPAKPAPPPADVAVPERARRRPGRPPAPAHAPATPATAELRVDADVPDAIAFLDRVYLGKVPVTAKDVTAGSHQLNVSAEGYEGIAQTIDVEPGLREIMIRFKEVTLNEAIDVVHKHTFGSCIGRLSASVDGLRYDTDDKGDAFAVAFDRVETFEVDYLKKNLRVKIRGGKTYNFTDRNENADALFVFHRNVTKARERIK